LKRIAVLSLAAVLLAYAVAPAGAVVLDDENTMTVTLKDGTQVKLYAEAGQSTGIRTRKFYYLPVDCVSPRVQTERPNSCS
jgi:hypothetical protein